MIGTPATLVRRKLPSADYSSSDSYTRRQQRSRSLGNYRSQEGHLRTSEAATAEYKRHQDQRLQEATGSEVQKKKDKNVPAAEDIAQRNVEISPQQRHLQLSTTSENSGRILLPAEDVDLVHQHEQEKNRHRKLLNLLQNSYKKMFNVISTEEHPTGSSPRIATSGETQRRCLQAKLSRNRQIFTQLQQKSTHLPIPAQAIEQVNKQHQDHESEEDGREVDKPSE
ncbi:hypothetical protein GCK72_001540 [Caenorhabditis remanei]|uniref:Uncharacterized protein n=1 Tax=Caenorhabditis remanei TaxID=31234 RepID=A0A6A5HU24_CAERE|nr:hypothetical protein GCK72_001540 [Caenorhabditis remanei]KAF1769723.1 hypothetical protein GCK72_001540 [Caenorhabditis remanei]